MYKFDYDPIDESELLTIDPTEVAFHNMKIGESVYNLNIFIGGQSGYFKANPNKNYQDLEKELRERNFTTHIIAKSPPAKSDLDYKLDMPENKSSSLYPVVEYKYEAIISCRPYNAALKELLQSWPSYEENFKALEFAGVIVLYEEGKKQVADITNNINENGDTVKLIKSNDPVHLIAENKVKVKITTVPAEEIMQNVVNGVIEKFGQEPNLRLLGMSPNGGPVMAFTIDDKIVSYTGVCFEHDALGNKITKIINLKEFSS